jgi:hypothetical protein
VVTAGGSTITASADAVKPLVLKGFSASQSANILEIQNSAGTVLAYINSAGIIFASNGIYGGGGNLGSINSFNAPFGTTTSVSMAIRARASQTADMQQWQNSGGTVVAKVDASGNITAASIVKTGGTSTQFLKADGSVDSSTYATADTAIATTLMLGGM